MRAEDEVKISLHSHFQSRSLKRNLAIADRSKKLAVRLKNLWSTAATPIIKVRRTS
jgi:hypothetical protein